MNSQTASIVEIVLGLMAAAVPLSILARRIGIPFPVMLVLGGLAICFIPGIPKVSLDPSLVFTLFLPPVLYQAALVTSWRDFKANRRAILLLAVGLVIFTTLALGYTVHAFVPALPLASALLLGAIVSPTDAAAATSVMHKMNLPRRIVTIIEGESLVNDATGLVAITMVIGAIQTGVVHWSFAAGEFCWLIAGGVAIGYVFGRTSIFLHRVLQDGSIEILISLILPFLTYLVAGSLHASGVLAVVAAGLVRGRHSSQAFGPQQRILALSFWDLIVFVVNTLAFILIGMQMKSILHALAGYAPLDLLRWGVTAAAATIVIRLVWVFPATRLSWFVGRIVHRETVPMPPWRNVAIVGWAGMRGVVSLAAALSIPESTIDGAAFPGRDLIVYLSFCVILSTLVFQGLTLSLVIDKLALSADTEGPAEEKLARKEMARAAVNFLGRLEKDKVFPVAILQEVSAEYSQKIHDLECMDRVDRPEDITATTEHRRRVRLEALAAQREKIQQLRHEGTIGDDIMHKIERRLDFYEAGLM